MDRVRVQYPFIPGSLSGFGGGGVASAIESVQNVSGSLTLTNTGSWKDFEIPISEISTSLAVIVPGGQTGPYAVKTTGANKYNNGFRFKDGSTVYWRIYDNDGSTEIPYNFQVVEFKESAIDSIQHLYGTVASTNTGAKHDVSIAVSDVGDTAKSLIVPGFWLGSQALATDAVTLFFIHGLRFKDADEVYASFLDTAASKNITYAFSIVTFV